MAEFDARLALVNQTISSLRTHDPLLERLREPKKK